MTNAQSTCHECGGQVIPSSGKNRAKEYRKGVILPIPDSYLIPICIGCKKEYLSDEALKHLNSFLCKLYEDKLLKEIESLKKKIELNNIQWYKNRDAIGIQSWIIPGPGKPIDYLKLSKEQREKFNDFIKLLNNV